MTRQVNAVSEPGFFSNSNQLLPVNGMGCDIRSNRQSTTSISITQFMYTSVNSF